MLERMIIHFNLHASLAHPINLYNETLTKKAKVKIVSNKGSKVIVKTVSNKESSIEPQDKYGHHFHEDLFRTYEISEDVTTFGACVQIYLEENLYSLAYVQLNELNICTGTVQPVFISLKDNQPCGDICLDYVIIKPWKANPLTISKQEIGNKFLLMGHRGCGKKRRKPDLENTLQSFSTAYSVGASFAELDIQLTKDLIPLVFHDFYASVYTKKRDGSAGRINIAIKDLTYEEILNFNMDFANNKNEFIPDEIYDVECYSLFPPLSQVLSEAPEGLGLLIEIKYPHIDGETKQSEFENFFCRDVVVDKTLDALADYHGNRPIIMCSFDPDICIMLKHKQNRFPILFITCGENTPCLYYTDLRSKTRGIAAHFANLYDILGISMCSDPLKNDKEGFSEIVSKLKDSKKHAFTWGAENSDFEYVRYQKSIGVTGVISDDCCTFDINALE